MGYSCAREIWIPTLADKPNAEYLFFPGCKLSDEFSGKSIHAIKSLLLDANVDMAILGEVNWCCGEQARSAGFEDLARLIAKRNIALWHSLGVKKIITTCTQCFDALQNEYRKYGGDFEVILHPVLDEDLQCNAKSRLVVSWAGRVG